MTPRLIVTADDFGMSLEVNEAVEEGHRNGVLTTQKRDGRPQLSNIVYHLGTDDIFRVSITATRVSCGVTLIKISCPKSSSLHFAYFV